MGLCFPTWIADSSWCLVLSKSVRMELISVRNLEFSDWDSSHNCKKIIWSER